MSFHGGWKDSQLQTRNSFCPIKANEGLMKKAWSQDSGDLVSICSFVTASVCRFTRFQLPTSPLSAAGLP